MSINEWSFSFVDGEVCDESLVWPEEEEVSKIFFSINIIRLFVIKPVIVFFFTEIFEW